MLRHLTIKDYGFLTKAELDTEFAHWHDQMRGWINGFIAHSRGMGSGYQYLKEIDSIESRQSARSGSTVFAPREQS